MISFDVNFVAIFNNTLFHRLSLIAGKKAMTQEIEKDLLKRKSEKRSF